MIKRRKLNELMRNILFIKTLLRRVRNILLLAPIHQVLRELEARGINLKDLNALEVFGGSGNVHTKNYVPYISSLEVWECNPKLEFRLKRNLPNANIKITDSYKEIKMTSQKYYFIVVDNPIIFGEHIEHFDLFPDIFRVAADSTILILTIIPEVKEVYKKRWPTLFNEIQLARRKAFYKTNHPEKLSFDEMIDLYKNLIDENRFNLEWCFTQERCFFCYRDKNYFPGYAYYLVLKINKILSQEEHNAT